MSSDMSCRLHPWTSGLRTSQDEKGKISPLGFLWLLDQYSLAHMMPTAVLVYVYPSWCPLLVSCFFDSPSSHSRLLSSLYLVSSPVGLLRYVLRYVWHSDAIPSLSNAIHSFINLSCWEWLCPLRHSCGWYVLVDVSHYGPVPASKPFRKCAVSQLVCSSREPRARASIYIV